eukprot:TRINITY_DN18186_c0_g1_i1.p1 TRINITY_DN18186_c0_g1~~TRINITY_DN18186_c0_g1_i1.p1  ORF type:complete len:220 (+),score=48.80 TRINITY_DN18186_c0_g1_i1:308-967(+)
MDADVECWGPRVQSTGHISAMQTSTLNSETHLCLDGSEGNDDMRACFPCPFCYMDIEVAVLCTHLHEEHCFDIKNVVCPVCAENLGRDMIGHFTVQHAHMLKWRKSQRPGQWTNRSAMLGKGQREASSVFGDGVASTNRRRNTDDSIPDPLLSPFLHGLAVPDINDVQEASSVIEAVVSTSLDAQSTELSTSNGDREQDDEERRQRAEFIQQLVLSTVF